MSNRIALFLLALLLGGCTDGEIAAVDRMVDGPAERARRDKVMVSMPNGQLKMLSEFRNACALYEAQINEIEKSRVYRESMRIYREFGEVKGWSGVLRLISTNQGGSNARLMIAIPDQIIVDPAVNLGSSAYKDASTLMVGQVVVFSGRRLSDHNVTERGKVCSPNFTMTITSIKKVE
jgi:hypothetical protein